MMRNNKTDRKQTDTIRRIAKQVLAIEHLEARHSDSLDFHDLAVWDIEEALKAAYEAGRKAR